MSNRPEIDNPYIKSMAERLMHRHLGNLYEYEAYLLLYSDLYEIYDKFSGHEPLREWWLNKEKSRIEKQLGTSSKWDDEWRREIIKKIENLLKPLKKGGLYQYPSTHRYDCE